MTSSAVPAESAGPDIASMLKEFGIVKYQRTPLGDSVDKASMRLLKESFNSASDKNVIVSPLGVLSLLAMVCAGCEREARDEILQLLNCTDYTQLEESYSSLTVRFTSMDASYLVLANRMYVSDKYTLNEQFSNVVSHAYKSEVEQVDFQETRAVVDSINKWADEKTKGHITSPVNAEMFDEDIAMALFNVIFFQGHWHIPFKAEQTENKKFYITTLKTVKKPMMKLKQPLYYHKNENLGARMVELPYKEKGFRMVIVLPDRKDGLQRVVEKLSKHGLLEDVFNLKSTDRDVDLQMPKFDIKSCHVLNNILQKVGVSRIFSEGTCGVVREMAVKVSKVFQEAFVKVDEEGATAGAFTGDYQIPVSTRPYVPPPPINYAA